MNTPWPVPPLARDIYERHPNSSHEVTLAETRLRWERDFRGRVAERLASSPGQLNQAIIEELRVWNSAPVGGPVPDKSTPATERR